MEENPLVSVVVPCLNRVEYLEPTLRSILDQDYPRIECLVMDGGSTDGSVEVLKKYEDGIRWVSEPDEGHADAINKGWMQCGGEILAWLNADDLWEVPGAVSRIVEHFGRDPEADLIYGESLRIDDSGKIIGLSSCRPWDLEHAVLYCDHSIPQAAAFIRKKVLERVGWLDTAFYQKKDHELWLRIALNGNIRYIPEIVARTRAVNGLSQEGKTAAPACVQVTRKFFSLPGIPRSIRIQKRTALANAWLKGSQYAWEGGRLWKTVLYCLARSILARPSNAKPAIQNLKRYLVDWMNCREKVFEALRIPLRLMYGVFRGVKFAIREIRACTVNFDGYREFSWSFVASRIPAHSGKAVEFAGGAGPIGLILSLKGYETLGVDSWNPPGKYVHPRLEHWSGDFTRLPLPREYYDLVVNVSAVEPSGMLGAYEFVRNDPEGDFKAMGLMKRLLKPGGKMILMVPVGRDGFVNSNGRIYSEQRLSLLFSGFEIEEESYFRKNEENSWMPCSRVEAFSENGRIASRDPFQNRSALGCFVLVRPSSRGGAQPC